MRIYQKSGSRMSSLNTQIVFAILQLCAWGEGGDYALTHGMEHNHPLYVHIKTLSN